MYNNLLNNGCPVVSVIMPCYNHAKYLGQSIEGVLGQSYSNLELIIVDDLSIDDSVIIIEIYKKQDERIKTIYHNANTGVSKSRNDAISISRGKYIAFCDADDIWERNKIEIQLEYINKNADYNVVCSDSIIINEDGIPTGDRFIKIADKKKYDKKLFYNLCLTNFINTQTVLFKRSCLNSKFRFDESMKYLEDWMYWIKLASENNILYIDMPLARYRIHDKSTSVDNIGYDIHRIKSYKHIIDEYPKLPKKIVSKLYYCIGTNYVSLGDNYQAKQYFIKSLKMNRCDIRNIFQIILIYFSHGNSFLSRFK